MEQIPTDIDSYIAGRLRDVMTAQALTIVLRAGEIAAEHGWEVYLVGGYARDCLLKIPDYDIDISVVGDALELTRLLAAETSARLDIHDSFGTATLLVDAGQFDIDVVTARRERYEQPGALPTVDAGTILDDMARRDFTINAMAVAVTQDGFGPFLDPHDGLLDLRAKLIRVLHDGSFQDDPTRILRAVKLAVRLGFKIELGTLELILQAIRDDAISTVSTERVVRELLLILGEPKAGDMLVELEKLGVLRALHPLLTWAYPDGSMGPAEEVQMSKEARRDSYLAVLGAELAGEPEEAEAVARLLRLSSPQIRLLRDSAHLATIWPQLGADELEPSHLYRLLQPIDTSTLEAYTRIPALSKDSVAWGRLHDYLGRLRHIKTSLNGDYLREHGVTPGPIYRRVLGALLDAKLDGKLSTRKDEERFVEKWLAQEARQGQ
ncbi:MAG: hypothetical protein ABI670_07925 [Chloroflexota bacterium]